ncbi:MAG: ABC transporter permease [Cyanobacteria bacterium HKST-UBA04]|nr:ABC transporter permease [Cyanobacteria bacterium HKST-UBA04]MCA9842790.1 ABC transporter permease [Cyanobacteria bacterium HKST-UBA03]
MAKPEPPKTGPAPSPTTAVVSDPLPATGTPPPATLWRTIWKECRRDQLVMAAATFLVAIYGVMLLSGFIAPYTAHFSDRDLAYIPPTPIFVVKDHRPAWPYVVPYKRVFDAETYNVGFEPDYSRHYPIRLFYSGGAYRLFNLIPTTIHLFGVDEPGRLFVLGTDQNGHDNFSRLLIGSVPSLTIGFLALLVVFPIGLVYGGASGYFGGRVDNLMMRLAEIIMSIPQFYLLIALAALLPSDINSTLRFALIVIILAFIGWAGLSRVIRGMVLSIKEQEYVEAAEALGASSLWVIWRHLIPQTATYAIVAVTLGVPGYLLAESALSFLGLGIQQPDASWGNMLSEAQNLSNIIYRPWLLMGPGLLIFFTILSFNVLGDKLRDVLDPKSQRTA